jgi:hypothetical protein
MNAKNSISELQIPPAPPLQSGESSPIKVLQLPHFELVLAGMGGSSTNSQKGGPGGILKAINYLRFNKTQFTFQLKFA